MWLIHVITVAILIAGAPSANAQTFAVRGFADVGSTTFAASQSFEAVLGTASGVMVGGGAEAVLHGVYVSLRASRFEKTGERVFVFGGEQFRLGVPATVTVTPVLLTAGYRFDTGTRVIPYAGAGVGWHLYREVSQFAEAGENVSDTFRGYQMSGGAEVRLARWLGLAAEAEWATVPDALGQDAGGVSHQFNETNLGGTTFRAKIVLGR